ncbi:ABC transporter permease (plasmid) [Streptomyces albidoflavus]|uniref:ABC transporter permease n=1 Tax=Streptomyces TaxID=1883 RepID=UPI0011638E81|nr:ABC transporter permease [Streptomyces sp. BSP1]MCQ9709725.1 ABC transporter permease [Streptomyces sp. BSP1]QDD62566.1 ABC transporter permease [Streptomyces albidoflavus]
MTTTLEATPSSGPGPEPGPGGPGGRPPGALRVFLAVLHRDVFVTGRELPSFLAQTVLQPLFTLFILGKVLGDLGYVGAEFKDVLLPGVVALAGFTGALQNTTLPLVLDFSYTREIEDRLLSPMRLELVAVEKVVFGAARGVFSAVLMIPIGMLVMGGVSWPLSALPALFGVIVLGSLVGAALGMTLGTFVPPRRIEIVFAVTLTPLMFTGATQFPWLGLADLRWFQVVCAANPLTYFSEALRALLLDGNSVESMPLWISLAVLVAALLGFGLAGIKGFMNRALD